MPIAELIKDFNRNELVKAQNLNNELSFYCENIDNFTEHPYYNVFRKKIKELYRKIEKENYIIKSYLNNRVPTNYISEKIFKGLKNVFDSQNQNISIIVENKKESEIIAEMQPYFDYFKTEGWNKLKGQFNSFLIIDIDKETKQPYIYNVLPEQVKYYKLVDGDKHKVKEIIFSFDNEIFYYYTDIFYSTYLKLSNNTFEEISKNPHGIGKCPASLFLFEEYNSYTEILRKTPVLSISDMLYWYSIKYAELIVSELIAANYTKVMPENSCGYVDGENKCMGGLVYYSNPESESGFSPVVFDDGTQVHCPCCGFNKHIGVGGTITVNMKQAAENQVNINDIIKYFTPPLEGTQYQKDRLKEYETEIINRTIGEVKKINIDRRNEKDIISDFEDSTKILTQFGYYFAKTIEFAYDTILRIKYGKSYKGVSIFLGNKFYLLSKEELLLQKEQCTNPVERSDIEMKMFTLDYQHDPDKLKAIKLIYENLPYSGTTDADFLKLVDLGKISDFDIELRMNINYYISKLYYIVKNDINVFDYSFINKKLTELVNDKLKNTKENGKTETSESRI